MSEEQARQILGDKYPEPKKRNPPQKSKKKHKPKPTHRPGVMNKTEAEYARRLDADPAVLYWQFEKLSFKLAKKTTYTPDFLVIKQDCMEIHEIKGGYEREDARVKWKAAAERFPMFRWFVARKIRGKWQVEEYGE